MKRLLVATLVTVVVGGVIGCGGGGAGAAITNEVFVGHWQGAWISTGSEGNQYGSADITVSAAGETAGTVHNATLSADATVSGLITYTGDLTAACKYKSQTLTLKGRVALSQSGHMTGSLSEYRDTYIGTMTLDLTKQ